MFLLYYSTSEGLSAPNTEPTQDCSNLPAPPPFPPAHWRPQTYIRLRAPQYLTIALIHILCIYRAHHTMDSSVIHIRTLFAAVCQSASSICSQFLLKMEFYECLKLSNENQEHDIYYVY